MLISQNGFNTLNFSVVERLRSLLKTLNPGISFPSLDTSVCVVSYSFILYQC